MKKALLLGCGTNHNKKIILPEDKEMGWGDEYEVHTVDLYSACHPTFKFDLNEEDWWRISKSYYDRVDAYEVLEHLGRQGDAKSFFSTFRSIWQVLKDGGALVATVPRFDSQWAWGDPTHTRVITSGSLVFLNQAEYDRQVGRTAMSDLRVFWPRPLNFRLEHTDIAGESLTFCLRKQPVY